MLGKNNVSPVAPLNRSQVIEDVRIRGLITSPELVVLAGQLDVDTKTDTRHIVSTMNIAGEATGQSVTIDGKVLGSIVADKAYLSATEYFDGQLHCQEFVIDNGADVDAKFIEVQATNG